MNEIEETRSGIEELTGRGRLTSNSSLRVR
jgi:hypothetical protein